MTSTETKTKAALTLRKKKDQPLAVRRGGGIIPGAASLPQVNLLPESVRADRALQRTRLWLLIGVGLVILASLLGYVMAMQASRQAQDELTDVQAETQRLLIEQAQYAEVPQVLGQISDAELAQRIAMGSEIDWAQYFVYVLAALPDDAKLTQMTTSTASPLLPVTTPGDALQTPGIGTVTFQHRSPTVPDLAEWDSNLMEIPGFASAQYHTASVSDDEGETYYEVTSTVQVTLEALSGRYLIEPEEDE